MDSIYDYEDSYEMEDPEIEETNDAVGGRNISKNSPLRVDPDFMRELFEGMPTVEDVVYGMDALTGSTSPVDTNYGEQEGYYRFSGRANLYDFGVPLMADLDYQRLEDVMMVFEKRIPVYRTQLPDGNPILYMVLKTCNNGVGSFIEDEVNDMRSYFKLMKDAGAQYIEVEDISMDVFDDMTAWLISFSI